MILAQQVGPCTPTFGFARFTVPGSAGVENKTYDVVSSGGVTITGDPITTNTTLVFFNPGSSDDEIARYMTLKEDPNDSTKCVVDVTHVYASAFEAMAGGNGDRADNDRLLFDDPDDGLFRHPGITSIPLRGSIRYRNVSEIRAMGGEVRVMQYCGGLAISTLHTAGDKVIEGPPSVTQYLEMCKVVRDAPRAVTMGAGEVRETHQTNCYPADFVESHMFVADKTFTKAVVRPRFCTYVMLIEDYVSTATGKNNTFSFGAAVHRACRYPPGSQLHNHAQVPPAHPDAANKLHTLETARVPAKKTGGGISDFVSTFGSAFGGALDGMRQDMAAAVGTAGLANMLEGAGAGSFAYGGAKLGSLALL